MRKDLIILAIAFILILIAIGKKFSNKEESLPNTEHNKTSMEDIARIKAETGISALFDEHANPKYNPNPFISNYGDTEFHVSSFVDVTNIYNRQIRHDYVMEFRVRNNEWNLVYLDLPLLDVHVDKR